MKGDVVVVPFPFSDLCQAKRRPALVVSELEGDDLVLCQITSQRIRDSYAIPLEDKNGTQPDRKRSVGWTQIDRPYRSESLRESVGI